MRTRSRIVLAACFASCTTSQNSSISELRLQLKPHCGEVTTVVARPNSITREFVHNCGGESGQSARELSLDEWRSLERVANEAAIFELPAEITPTLYPDGTITVTTDDTVVCVGAQIASRSKTVCGGWTALKLNPASKRLVALVESLERAAK